MLLQPLALIITHIVLCGIQKIRMEPQASRFPTYPDDGKGHPVDHSTINALEGSNVTLPCQTATPGEFYGIYWTHLDRWKLSRYAYGFRIGHEALIDPYLFGRVSLTNGNLSINNIKQGDNGTYECVLVYFYEKTGSIRATVWALHVLNVLVRPKVVIDSYVSFPSTKETVEFNCNVTKGTNPINFSWKTPNGTPPDGRKFDVVNKGTQLVIKNVTTAENGEYRCIAANPYGNSTEVTTLKVKVAPKIVNAQNSFHINVNTDGQLVCRAYSFPAPNFQWRIKFENGSKLTLKQQESYNRQFSVSEGRNISSNVTESYLVLKNIKKAIWRHRFTCIASNSEGETAKDFIVSGYDYPSRPSIRRIKISSTTVTIYWSVNNNGGAPLTSVLLWYRNISQIGWSERRTSPVSSTELIQDGLTPDTAYEFKLAAANEVGLGVESGIYSTRTRIKGKKRIVSKQPPSHLIMTSIGISAGMMVALVVAICCGVVIWKKMKKSPRSRHEVVHSDPGRPLSVEGQSLQGGDNRVSEVTSLEMEPLLPQLDRWEFPRDRLRMGCVLGSGAFGLVRRAEAEGIQGTTGRVKVAVKMLKENEAPGAKKDLLAELNVLKSIPNHPNVVCLLGCCTRNDPILVIVEYCQNGDLQGFLRNSRGINERYYRSSYGGSVPNLTSKMLLTFGQHIARGMRHLASRKVVHRDLAARNILVDEKLVCKVGDFGFARDIYVEDHYMRKSQNGRFPVKWMAIESLVDTISTSKSDVWSFGVVLWEIITLAASPYPGMNAYEVVTFLQDGYRMDKPKHCSDELYAVLIDCWHVWPQRRPSFEELAKKLKRMCENNEDDINLNYYQDHLYVNFDLPTNGTSSSLVGSGTESNTARGTGTN